MQSNQPDLSAPGRILIVDDEENIRRGLRAILVKDGHEVNDVGSAEGALRLLDTFSWEVAIVDIRMPGMSGVELLHEIRNRWPYVAIIMLTGHYGAAQQIVVTVASVDALEMPLVEGGRREGQRPDATGRQGRKIDTVEKDAVGEERHVEAATHSAGPASHTSAPLTST